MNAQITTTFTQQFGEPLVLVHAPGRINLIGEHTDYNQGFVFPAAIDKGIAFAIGPSGNSSCKLIAQDLGEEYSFDIHELSRSNCSWANYLLGVCAQFQQAGFPIHGFNCVFGGDIPVGAGLSSSAALECGLGFGLANMWGIDIDRMELAFLAQKAEHTYAGVQCGIMDQFASLFGKAGQVVQLDCRSMEYSYFPFDASGYQFLLCDTKVSHSLASTEYNTRRQECEAGVSVLQPFAPHIQSLRDVEREMLLQHQDLLDPTVFQRCLYVIEENLRVAEAGKALVANDMNKLGSLMYASHHGLQHQYQVSCEELDFLVDTSRKMPEILGARMMGGGFGGCTINLLRAESVDKVAASLKEAYQNTFKKEPGQYIVRISDGVHILEKDS
ncbi:MAG: galactokinase [Bacteroidota bacterium]